MEKEEEEGEAGTCAKCRERTSSPPCAKCSKRYCSTGCSASHYYRCERAGKRLSGKLSVYKRFLFGTCPCGKYMVPPLPQKCPLCKQPCFCSPDCLFEYFEPHMKESGVCLEQGEEGGAASEYDELLTSRSWCEKVWSLIGSNCVAALRAKQPRGVAGCWVYTAESELNFMNIINCSEGKLKAHFLKAFRFVRGEEAPGPLRPTIAEKRHAICESSGVLTAIHIRRSEKGARFMHKLWL